MDWIAGKISQNFIQNTGYNNIYYHFTSYNNGIIVFQDDDISPFIKTVIDLNNIIKIRFDSFGHITHADGVNASYIALPKAKKTYYGNTFSIGGKDGFCTFDKQPDLEKRIIKAFNTLIDFNSTNEKF